MIADATSEISLCSSKFELCKKENTLYNLIIKAINKFECPEHQLKYNYYFESSLICYQCLQRILENDPYRVLSKTQLNKLQYFYNLECILNHPMLLAIDQQQILQQPIEITELLLNEYRNILPKRSKSSGTSAPKNALILFLEQIRCQIDQIIADIIQRYSEGEDSLAEQYKLQEDIMSINQNYHQQFYQILTQQFTEGTKEELEDVFKDFKSCSEDPFSNINQNLSNYMTAVQQSPVINWEALKSIYTKVTDHQLWDVDNLVVTYAHLNRSAAKKNPQIIFPNQSLLINRRFCIDYSDHKLVLFKIAGQEKEELAKLKLSIDSLYHLHQYRLLGVSYDKIYVISYAFSQLTLLQEYNIMGCTDLLTFDDQIVLVSNSKLIRLDLSDKKYEVIGINYSKLRYRVQPNSFECKNEQQRTCFWNVRQNRPFSIQ